jgi:hypothetical protein
VLNQATFFAAAVAPKGRDGFALRDFEHGDVILWFERGPWWTNFASH